MPPLPRLPWWHPQAFARRRPFLDSRTRVLHAVRHFFATRDFTEVETPALLVSPGMEVHLMAFSTEYRGHRPEERQTFHLHTSPEFAMKKLLVAGVPRLFQTARVFRNGERTAIHHPEFTMLEWYRAQAGYRDLMDDCVTLVRDAARAAECDRFTFRGHDCDPFAEWRVLTVSDAFHDYAGIDLLATAPDPANPDTGLLKSAAAGAGIQAHAGDTWEDLFFRILLEKIEPWLGMGVPTFLTDYPVAMACLARPRPDDPRVAERFELYACGLELANAFGELTDAAVQRTRFETDMATRQRLYGSRYPVDEDFLDALAFGMPDSAGIALGLDRLVMLCAGADDIADVLWAPVAPWIA